jgi:hypothetical protein
MRLRKLALFLELLDDLPGDLWALAIFSLMLSMIEAFQDPLTCRLHLLIAVFRRRFHIRHLLFERLGCLYDDIQTIDHTAIGEHGCHNRLKPRHAPLHVIIGLVDAKDGGASLMMRQCPVQADDLAPASPMVTPHRRAVPLDAGMRVPSRLKDGCMPGATARLGVVPPVELIEALQGLVRTEDEASDIPTDVLKSLPTTTEVSKTGHASGNRLRYPSDRQPVILPPWCPSAGPRLGASLQRAKLTALSCSLSPFLAITFQVVSLSLLSIRKRIALAKR